MQKNGSPEFPYDDEDEYEDEFDPLDDLTGQEPRRASNRDRGRRRRARNGYPKPGRQPASEREGSFNALLWLLDGATGFMEELRHNDLGLSEEFWMHAYAARRESLMAARALLETWIDEDEKEEPAPPRADEPPARKPRRGSINIDF